jgi:hypothetical protein
MTNSISYNSKDTKNEEENGKNIIKELTNSFPKTIRHFFRTFGNHLKRYMTTERKADTNFPSCSSGQ